MCCETFPVFKEKKSMSPDLYVLIEYTQIPEMYPEFAPGPEPDDPWGDFWNTAITVFLMDPHAHTVSEIGFRSMQQMYKYIEGRRQRIAYWRVMKYLEHWHKEETTND